MEAATAVYREYEIQLQQDQRTGRWQSRIRPLRRFVSMPDADDDDEKLGPFLTPEAACREAEWRIELLRA